VVNQAHLFAKTLDDLLLAVLREIKDHGERVCPTKPPNKEIAGVVLELENPRARISRTETKGKPFSCLGELCWYLAKTNRLGFIEYYIPAYKKDDLTEEHNDVPCTCTLQVMVREEKLHMLVHMRSNDAFIGLPHDIFCFTMLQEIISRSVSRELGAYKHMVGSLHLYDQNIPQADEYLEEGFQSSIPMPAMPIGDPWPSIHLLLDAESSIRTTGVLDHDILAKVDDYWADLVRLLQIFRCKKLKDRDIDKLMALRRSMSSNVYSPFIEKVISDLS